MMAIAIFTSNQPRHIAFLRAAAARFDDIVAFVEVTTIFPGEVEDFYAGSPTMKSYFTHVRAAERAVFGTLAPMPAGVRVLPMRMGDIAHLRADDVAEHLAGRTVLVFGASFIRPPLVDLLISGGALNIHAGIAPHYRGNSCNFWALSDGRPELVGTTVHRLTRGLDTGAVLFHALPVPKAYDPFQLGMHAVRAGQTALLDAVASGRIEHLAAAPQDPAHRIRYTKRAEFTDAVAQAFLDTPLDAASIGRRLAGTTPEGLINPVYL